MSLRVAVKALVVWFAILALAVVNGLLREKVLVPNLGAVPGMVLSGALLCCLIVAVTYLFIPWLGVLGSGQLVLIGAGWLLLTLIFEFSFGLLSGRTLAEILEPYSFKGGNFWPAVLLVTAASPWLTARLRGWV